MRSTVDTEKLATAVRLKRRDMTLKQISEETGLNHQTIAKIEKAGRPDVDTFVTLCEWLGIEAEYFIRPAPNGRKQSVQAA